MSETQSRVVLPRFLQWPRVAVLLLGIFGVMLVSMALFYVVMWSSEEVQFDANIFAEQGTVDSGDRLAQPLADRHREANPHLNPDPQPKMNDEQDVAAAPVAVSRLNELTDAEMSIQQPAPQRAATIGDVHVAEKAALAVSDGANRDSPGTADKQPLMPQIQRENCVVTYASGNRYEGQCSAGKKDGYGVFFWKSGDRYEGQWQNNIRHGRGIMHAADGTSTQGEWLDGVVQGIATIQWPSGTRYEGNVRNGQGHGYGSIFYSNGDIYKGEFKNGLKSGFGVLVMGSGAKYQGEYKNNRKHGKGIYWNEKGARYEGKFKYGYFTQDGFCYSVGGAKTKGPCQ